MALSKVGIKLRLSFKKESKLTRMAETKTTSWFQLQAKGRSIRVREAIASLWVARMPRSRANFQIKAAKARSSSIKRGQELQVDKVSLTCRGERLTSQWASCKTAFLARWPTGARVDRRVAAPLLWIVVKAVPKTMDALWWARDKELAFLLKEEP